MGSLVSRAQLKSVREGSPRSGAGQVLHDGSQQALVDADPAVAACIGPVLLGAKDADAAPRARLEVFGPVATLLPYRDLDHAVALAHRGQGSLVTSLYGSDNAALGRGVRWPPATAVCTWSRPRSRRPTGHGNVMPISMHGGPGRAGGGAELGGCARWTSTTAAARCRPAPACWRAGPELRTAERAWHNDIQGDTR